MKEQSFPNKVGLGALWPAFPAKVAVALLLFISASASAWAVNAPPPRRGDRNGPPTEAMQACKDKSEGDAVEFTTPRGDTLKATCRQIKGQLAAVPDDNFRGQRGMPQGGRQGRR